MKKMVIYTAVVGGYDEIKQPLAVDERFDYVLFSNDIAEKQVGVWQVKPIPYHNPIQSKIARWVKTHPEELLAEYESSLWIDANIQIVLSSIYERVVQLNRQDCFVSAITHPDFDCVYEEMFYMILGHYDHESVILRWGNVLMKERYPFHNGTCETGVLFRKHVEEMVRNMDEIWWNAIEKYSRRDQLSFPFAIWRVGLKNTPFLRDGVDVRNSDSLNYIIHSRAANKWLPWQKDEAWLCRYVNKHPESITEIKNRYFQIFKSRNPQLKAWFWGQIYRIKDICLRMGR